MKIIKKLVKVLLSLMLISIVSSQFIIPSLADNPGIKQVSMGINVAIILKDDGTVWYTGFNRGLHGDGTMDDKCIPSKIPIENVSKVSAGFYDYLALKNDGTVWTWGSNTHGARGDGTHRPIPQDFSKEDFTNNIAQVPGLSDIIDIDSATLSYFAIKSDGTVWAWGENYEGQLGDGTNQSRYVPEQIPGLKNITAISGSGITTFALDDKGQLWAWGGNGIGQIGDGTTMPSYTPKVIMDHVKHVSAHLSISMAIKDDGTLWAWGKNTMGELGDGTTTARHSPVQVPGMSNVISVFPGDPTYALTGDGSVWQWGYTYEKYSWVNDKEYPQTTPEKLDITGVKAISSYSGHTVMAIKYDGSLWSWGSNYFGERGIGVPFQPTETVLTLTDQSKIDMSKPTKVLTNPGATPVPLLSPPPDEIMTDPQDNSTNNSTGNTTISPTIQPNATSVISIQNPSVTVGHTVTPTSDVIQPVSGSAAPQGMSLVTYVLLGVLGVTIIAAGAVYMLFVKKK